MTEQELALIIFALPSVLGVVGGCMADRFPASLRTALAFCFVAPAGVGLAKTFC